jgi:hypothetical protein
LASAGIDDAPDKEEWRLNDEASEVCGSGSSMNVWSTAPLRVMMTLIAECGL